MGNYDTSGHLAELVTILHCALVAFKRHQSNLLLIIITVLELSFEVGHCSIVDWDRLVYGS
jgi:hypothetical protein